MPRTPNALALGMMNGEPAVYKNGVLTKVSGAPESVVACSAPAVADAREAAGHYRSYNTNARIGAMFNALGVFAPPMIVVGLIFTSRATDHQQKSYVHVVDAINRHNDEIGCVQR